jgi:nucleoside-diphosphate-sugar epimerase
MDGKCVLVTGGTGYIGSHTVLALLDAGASVVIVDNLVNSSEEVLPRMRELAGAAATRMTFVKVRSVAYARGGWKQSGCACLWGTCHALGHLFASRPPALTSLRLLPTHVSGGLV